jgi:hypothetical protein
MSEDFFDEVELDDSEDSPARLAYIKAIDVDEARALGASIPSEIKLPPGVKLYALHAADGTTIGITDNWAAAYSAAVQNNFVPLSVH